MRIDTVRYDGSKLRVVQWARWAGVGVLFWAAALALDQIEIYTGDAGFWPLLALFLPYVAVASVLLFSHHRMGDNASSAPVVLAGLLVLASLALAVRVLSAEEPVMGPVYGEGVWSAVQILVGLGLPMAVLLVLLTQHEGRLGEIMPAVAIGAGILVSLGSWALSMRDLLELDGPNTWRVVTGVVPAHAIGLALIVAGLRVVRPELVRLATFSLAGLLVVGAIAAVGYWLSFAPFDIAWWSVGTNLVVRAAYVVLLLAFGGVLTRPVGYAAAVAVLIAVVIASIGMTLQVLDNEGANWFWVPTFGIMTVLSTLLIALVTIEVGGPEDPSGSRPEGLPRPAGSLGETRSS